MAEMLLFRALSVLLTLATLQEEGFGQNQRPIFDRTTYIAEIKEEQNPGLPVIQVKASVVDGSTTTYRLDTSVVLFTIDQSVGMIYVKGRLDRESVDTQRFYAYAKNTANNLESQVEVVVHLSDINDNTPVITNLPATVKLRENVQIGTVFFTVAATDADTSRNALLTYSISSGNEGNKFTIDAYSGKISTAHTLDFETTKDYNISVYVQDSGLNETKSNESSLRIQVQDHDDQPAKFVKEKYTASVPENSIKGYYVTTVKAVDLDTAINAPVEYSIYQESNPAFAFSIDALSGVIVINNTLDRESISKYFLRVKARSTIFNPDYASVEVSVSDQNDNRPIFKPDRYEASITESAKVGTTLFSVSATDKDEGTNAKFSYAIVGGDAKFAVASNGDVYVDGNLDREIAEKYQFVIVAFETLTTERYDSSAKVYITVTDANDNPPEFGQPLYHVNITEQIPIGSFVIKVKATDKDIGVNAEIVYSISDGTDNYIPFKINENTGEVFTSGTIDREVLGAFSLTVYARNQKSIPALYANASLQISVVDSNDNSPKFDRPQYNMEIAENLPPNTFVFQFKALDGDIGQNAALRYELVEISTKFKLDAQNGELRTTVELDREKTSVHTLIIRAIDGNGRNGTTVAVVQITDMNDNHPQFQHRKYQFFAMEETENVFIGQVKAVDEDSGQNANVTYTLGSDSKSFSINSVSGVITCKSKLDYEIQSSYNLTVIASDNGTPRNLVSYAVVNVTVLDANDHRPKFRRRIYLYNITENALSSAIGMLEASDEDEGLNAALKYTIVSGNDNGDFSINPNSGALSAVKPLDYERNSLYIIIVSVSDLNGDKGGYEDLAAVQINIKDENDNSPSFEQKVVPVAIYEDALIGSSIAKLSANDVDSGINKEIRYEFSSGNKNQRFSIDPNSGTVTVRSPIERDAPSYEKNFELTVVAKDMGVIPRSSVAKLLITIMDSNDNSPVFYPAESTVNLMENLPSGTVIFTPNCTDKDSGNNARLSFLLIKGSESDFQVNPFTGVITTNRLFDYDNGMQSYEVIMQASDFGSPQRRRQIYFKLYSSLTPSSTTKVKILLENSNDNSPIFEFTGPFTLAEGDYTTVKHKVGQLIAYDNDSDSSNSLYGSLNFQVVNMSSYFYDFLWLFDSFSSPTTVEDKKLNATARLFGAKLSFDDAFGNVAKLSGAPNYILIGDFKNDCISNPSLCTKGLSLSMWIKFEAGGYILSSGAQSNHATGLALSFQSGKFKVVVATTLSEYQLMIDNVPTEWYYFTITWSKESGLAYFVNGSLVSAAYSVTAVTKISDIYTELMIGRPNDADSYSQLYGRFYIGELIIWRHRLLDYEVMHAYVTSERRTGIPMQAGNVNISAIFQLNDQSGEIFTSANIDREERISYKLDIMVSDKDPITPRKNYTQVEIKISDINDNQPVFLQNSWSLKVVENVAINSELLKIIAIDRDAGQNGQVSYSIVFGNKENAFSVGPTNGILTNIGIIDREAISSYTLQIAASDGGNPARTSTTMVNIEVLDANDEYPKFSNDQYIGYVKENTPPGQLAAQVSASDKDAGSNGTVRYNISSNYFSIDQSIGRIVNTKVLDREITAKHTLIVTAFDGGTPAKYTAVVVIIHVIDVNDNAPAFEKPSYNAVITENRKVGSSVIQITAKDLDADSNGQVVYSLGGAKGIFKIDPASGLVTTADIIDREKYPNGFIVEVKCTDQGLLPRFSSVNLFINISDTNDNSPVFTRFSYRGRVTENEVGAVVVVVNATDADSGLAGEIQYFITGGNSEGMFVIDNEGTIKTAKGLDRENRSAYELVVRAEDRGGEPKFAIVEVGVEVLDANDNAPVINEIPKSVLISEATLIGSQVITLTASDQDLGKNGMISFYGYSAENKFFIEPKTGVVTTVSKFDFEEKSRYTFAVEAVDNGSPRLNSTMVILNFTVVDSNDNNPVFYPSSYVAAVKENSPTDTFIVKVNASESDTSPGIGYHISNGNHDEAFQINNLTGVITVNRGLNREKVSIYYLLITATDNDIPPRLGQAYVTITILDENDLAPKFHFTSYRGEIKENVPIGSSVLTVSAFDSDLSNTTKLEFRITEGNIGNAFGLSSYNSLNEYTATIKTNGRIDRETREMYNLRVTVTDGRFYDFVNITIKVIDVNDNLPIFNSSIYQAKIHENEVAGRLILTISATDSDEGQNAVLRYSIENSIGKLFIDRSTGEITTTAIQLDRESEEVYDVLCSAQDSGGLKGYAIVRITVLDKNDMKPKFNKVNYAFETSEGPGSSGLTVAKVAAADLDEGENAKVIYTIKSGNIGNAFAIHPQTGIVTSITELDREQSELKRDSLYQRGIYELIIEASDQGIPSLTSEIPAKVSVFVSDINDNAPVFPANGYSVFISEGALANQAVIGATAYDADTGNNSKLTYEIISGNKGGDFKVNEDTGQIITAKKLERQKTFQYNLTIKARDMGTPTLASQTQVQIMIGDTNDNAPIFKIMNHSVEISESIPVNQVILNVSATDADTGQNSIITYQIVGGNEDQKFSITNHVDSASIVVKNGFDREIRSYYQISIMAEDGGIPYSRMALTYLTVKILDENDNPPKLSQLSYSGIIEENVSPGTLITMGIPVRASDADIGNNAAIAFTLIGEDSRYFTIDKISGIIQTSTTASIDFELRHSFAFWVGATDGLGTGITVYSNVTVTVVDLNDNTPHFPNSRYRVEVPESVGNGHLLLRLNASDQDSGYFGSVHYRIVSGSDGKFSIDATSGIIQVISLLDREKKDSYILNVSAYDGGIPPSVGYATVFVNVTDVNDNFPVFITKQSEVRISETTAIGTSITRVQANDADINEYKSIIYNMRNDKFEINSVTGVITTRDMLDRETIDSYMLTITATDSGGHQSNLSMMVRIDDVNDNQPRFLTPNPLIIDVFEKTPNGSIIAMVEAVDNDHGMNAKIEYRVSEKSGNLLRIDNKTGILRLSSTLDVSELSRRGILSNRTALVANITATDHGSPRLSRQISLTVNVIDINEENPYFNSTFYTAKLMENSQEGTFVTQLTAVKTSLSSRLTYSFTNGQNQFFKIEETTGIITSIKKIDREASSKSILNVKVNDNELPPRFGYTSVIVEITDLNDNLPAFDRRSYNMGISEDSAVGITLGAVNAIDRDTGNNGRVMYRFLQADIGKHQQMVTLGSICMNPLGMEDQRIAANRITSSTTLLEENKDFSPTQGRLNNVRYLKSGIQYQGAWCSGVAGKSEYLEIDLTEEKIVTKIAIQGRPEEDNYVSSFALLYSDDAKHWTTSSKIYQGVTDSISTSMQDVIPEIRARYIRINPLAWNVRICLRVEIYGCDLQDADIVRVPFQIDKTTGVISVSEPLDRERKESYKVLIEAYDNGTDPLNSTSLLEIKLLDANDNAPVFERLAYNASVAENSLPGTEIATVTAHDSDAGKNADIVYKIKDGFSRFTIEPSTGIVRVSGHLDYEKPTARQFAIELIAVDSGSPSLNSTAILNVNITDVNDNAPLFNKSDYSIKLLEGANIGEDFTVVTATDIDEGTNSEIQYQIDEGTDVFEVNNATGALRPLKEIDRERNSGFRISIRAVDKGFPPKHSSAKIHIIVIDKNDNTPVFTEKNFVRTISETTNIGSVVAAVTATDADMGANSKLTYSIIPGNHSSLFHMNEETGQVILLRKLDREMHDLLILDVLVKDNGSPSLNDSAQVTIFLADENDNSPVIHPSTIETKVKEDADINHVVIKLNATDNDIGDNGKIKFFLVHGGDNKFSIDESTGVIKTSMKLDREATSHYSLVIMAKDQGTTPLYGFATVKINLIDVNDNAPQFLEPIPFLSVYENQPKGTAVGYINASDKDSGENAEVLYFLSESTGSQSEVFTIDQTTGLIRTLQILDREQRESHNISINATNLKSNFFTSTTRVFTIVVLDVNDNAPYILPSSLTGAVSEAAGVGTKILTLRGNDLDLGLNAKLAFNIKYDESDEPSDFLAINSQSGVISTRLSILNRELRNITVAVEVSDFGLPHRLNSTSKVTIIIKDVNDNSPEFLSNVMKPVVSEGAQRGALVYIIEIIDKDHGTNTETVFTVLSGNELGHFHVNPSTGAVTLNSSVDRETNAVYALNISIANKNSMYNNRDLPIFRTGILEIHIADINDNAPFFNRPVFTGGIPSSAKTGTYIMTIQASDLDIGPHGSISYTFANGNQEGNFRIDSVTGKIYSAATLVRKTGIRFEIAVSASDNNGNPPFNIASNLTTARIYILQESQRAWLVLGVESEFIERNKQELTQFLSNITQSTVYIESVIKVMTKDGMSRSEIVFHSVDDKLGVIKEAEFVIKKIENDLKYYQAQNSKWKIENINPFTSKQTNSSNEMEAHVIALIVTGAIIGLVLIFALSLFIRLRRIGLLTKVSDDDPISVSSKASRRRRAKHFSDDTLGWINQYGEWWKKDDPRSAGNMTDDDYIKDRRINLLKQGMLSKRNRALVLDENDKRYERGPPPTSNLGKDHQPETASNSTKGKEEESSDGSDQTRTESGFAEVTTL